MKICSVKNKLKDKLIRKLGGYTVSDMRIRTRPERVAVSRFSIQTLKVAHAVRTDMIAMYSDYKDHAMKDMAYQLADKMLDDGLIEFHSEEEQPEMMKFTAIAKIVMPTEVSE